MASTTAAASPTRESAESAALARFVLAFVAAATVARLILIFGMGLVVDEAYGIVVARTPALSYFDHPPLHQWIVGAFARAFGEGRIDRLAFLPFSLLTSVALFGLARRLLSPAAGWWTLFLFNACGYFVVYADGYIMPDLPMLALVACGVWAVAEAIYGPDSRAGWLWIAAGLAFGLAGLAKYAAIFAPLALMGFFVASPRHRRWLWDRRPYIGAALALAVFAPALIWNAEHGWVSFAFQTGRATKGFAPDLAALKKIYVALSTQIGVLTPWIWLPLVAGLWRARRGDASSPERLLLWLAGAPLLYFTLIPLTGQLPLAHWFNSGWLFAFPLAGAWLAERSSVFRRRFALSAAALAALGTVLFGLLVNFGPSGVLGLADPRERYTDYPAADLREIYRKSGAGFVLVEEWRIGGKLGVALGPAVPICGMGPAPQGFAFACDTRDHLGQDALIVRVDGAPKAADERPYFAEIEAGLQTVPLGVHSGRIRALTFEVGRRLTAPPPLPYGP